MTRYKACMPRPVLPVCVTLLVASVPGCYPVRNAVPPGPGADTALSNTLPSPVRDPADDPDTASPVEAQDPPGDAGTLTPGGLGAAPGRPVRVGRTAAANAERRASRPVPSNRAVLDAWQARQRAELDARRAFQESGRRGTTPR